MTDEEMFLRRLAQAYKDMEPAWAAHPLPVQVYYQAQGERALRKADELAAMEASEHRVRRAPLGRGDHDRSADRAS